MGFLDFKSENGQFTCIKESGKQIPTRQLRNNGTRSNEANRPLRGAFLSNAKVKMFKVIMLRFPSCSSFFCLNLFKKKRVR